MDLPAWLRRRRFEQPFSKARQEVGAGAIFLAMIGGPLYYFRKGALIEGVILLMLVLLPYFVADGTSFLASDLFSYAVWAAFTVFAPLLLGASLRRRGWVEIGAPAAAEWDPDEADADLAPAAGGDAAAPAIGPRQARATWR